MWKSTRQYLEYLGCVTMLPLYPFPPPSLKHLSYAPAHERLVHALNFLSNVQKQQQQQQQ